MSFALYFLRRRASDTIERKARFSTEQSIKRGPSRFRSVIALDRPSLRHFAQKTVIR